MTDDGLRPLPEYEPPAHPASQYRIPPGGCTVQNQPGQPIGPPCQVCGHTNVTHPGFGNPGVTSCILCRLEEQAQRGAVP